MSHVALIEAFANKFNTFTGAVKIASTGEVISERFDTYDAARNFAKTKAWEICGPINYSSVKFKKGAVQYRAFCYA